MSNLSAMVRQIGENNLDQYFSPSQIREIRQALRREAEQGLRAGDRRVASGSPVSFLDRAALSFSGTGEKTLQDRGYEPVRLNDGSMGVLRDGEIYRVDPKGFDAGDFADFARDVPETILGTIGGIAGAASPLPGGAYAGAAAGSGLGDLARQGIGRLLGSEQEDVDYKSAALSTAMGAAGEAGGRLLPAAFAPLKRAVSPRNRATVAMAKELDQTTGGRLAETMPLSGQSDSGLLGQAEARFIESPLTADVARENITEPFREAGLDVLRSIGRRGNLDQPVGRRQAGDAVQDAAQKTLQVRRQQVDRAFEEVRELVADNQPIVPTHTIETAQKLFNRVKDTAGLQSTEGAKRYQRLAAALADAENITTFTQLDGFRKEIGREIGSGQAGPFQAVGLDAELRQLYGALSDDVSEFFAQGGRLGEEQLGAFSGRQVGPLAQEARQEAAEKLSVSEAIGQLGGMDVSGLTAGEMTEATSRRLKRLQASMKRRGRVPSKPDIMADMLREQYPELGIENLKDLKEAISNDVRFTRPIELATDESAAAMTAARPMTRQPFDVASFERELGGVEAGDDVRRLLSEATTAGEQGYLSRFDQRRLANMGRMRLADLEGGLEAGERASLLDDVMADRTRQQNLGREITQKGQRALSLSRESFEIDRSAATNLLNDPEKAANIARAVQARDYTAAQLETFFRKIGAMPGESGLAVTPEGQAARDLIAAEIFDGLQKIATKTPQLGTPQTVSGTNLLKALDDLGEDKAALLLGEEPARELFQLATVVKEATANQYKYMNTSRTAQANQMNELVAGVLRGIFNMKAHAARIAFMGASIPGIRWAGKRALSAQLTPGRGPRTLLGQRQELLGSIGRIGGQALQVQAQPAAEAFLNMRR